MMNIKIDQGADAAYVKLKNGAVHRTVAHGAEFFIDVDKDGNVIGVEILNYSRCKLTPEMLDELLGVMQDRGRNRS